MRNDFGISFGLKPVSFAGEPLFEVLVVFDDSVMRNIETPRAVRVWMRVYLAGSAVSRPACVADTAFDRAIRAVSRSDFRFQIFNSADGTNEFGPAFIHDGNATRVITAIFQTFQAINQNA